MSLPASGAISLSQVNTELGYSASATISLNDALVRKLGAKPSGAISLNDLHGKQGHFTYTHKYTHSYPWTPPATQAFSSTLSSATTTGNYQGTLSKSGGQTNTYGSYAWYGGEVLYQDNTTGPTAVGTQIGATWISGTYEYRWVVNRSVNVGYWSYKHHYDVWKKQQRRLITVNQNYAGTVYLRG